MRVPSWISGVKIRCFFVDDGVGSFDNSVDAFDNNGVGEYDEDASDSFDEDGVGDAVEDEVSNTIEERVGSSSIPLVCKSLFIAAFGIAHRWMTENT